MDPERLDDIARMLTTGTSRRRILAGLANGAASLLLTQLGQRATGAQGGCRLDGETCRRAEQCCGGVCDGGVCAYNCPYGWYELICYVNGAPFCVYDTASDPYNCGGCGIICESGICSGGSCVAASYCDIDLTDCGGTCVNLATDPNNCGVCGATCESGICDGGVCGSNAPVCSAGLTNCVGVCLAVEGIDCRNCVDLTADPEHCGACFNACESGICSGGTCVVPLICDSGLTDCGDYCADLATDSSHCGACFSPCTHGTVCVGGQCGFVCAQDSDCPTAGLCQSVYCDGGSCRARDRCPEGVTCCAGDCPDLTSDPNNCGTCGNVCATGLCQGAQCVAPPLAPTATSVPAPLPTPTSPPPSTTCARPLCNGVCCQSGEECLRINGTDQCMPFVCLGPDCQTSETSQRVACGPGRAPCGAACCEVGTTCIDNLCIPTELHACLSTGQLCSVDSECNLGLGEVCCSGHCVNVSCEQDHCGRCDKECQGGRRCVAGVCLPPGVCPAGMTVCGNTCCSSTELCSNATSCDEPPGLDFLGISRVCAPSETIDRGDRGDYQCSLQRIYGQDKVLGCALDVVPKVLKPLLNAMKAQRVGEVLDDIVEDAELPLSTIEVAKAETNLDRIVEGLGFVLPTDCIIGLAEVLSGGQYTALELCLSNDRCTEQLQRSLGLPV